VLIARHGADALRLFELHDQDVAAVLSDVVMPEISGPDLIEQLRKRRPQLKAVLMSGYTGTMVDAERLAALDASFLQKPFTSEMLVNAIENGGRGGK
jgi:DNA-binding NtrC family response regulator